MTLSSLIFRASFLAAGVLAQPQPVITSDDCITTTVNPTATVTYGGGSYEQCYTLTYDKWCATGLCPHAYTITQTCDDIVCRGPTETALPPGFTRAAVACSSCGGDGPVTKTLTLPLESVDAWKGEGYGVKVLAEPTGEPGKCDGDDCEEDDCEEDQGRHEGDKGDGHKEGQVPEHGEEGHGKGEPEHEQHEKPAKPEDDGYFVEASGTTLVVSGVSLGALIAMAVFL